jgi:kinetochore protein Nuf2
VSDSIGKTRPRIVQSPERIKRAITTMGSAAMEDKRIVAMNEQKARDLTAKYNALLAIEKVIDFIVDCVLNDLIFF